MKQIVKVRNLKIGQGRPKICVPLVGQSNNEILEEAKFLKNLKIDLVELRIDYYKDIEDLDKVKKLLKELRKEITNLPILFTLRSKKEGGEKEISLEYYLKLNKEICLTKLVDLIDVELFSGEDIVLDIVNTAHKNNIKVVISNHDFLHTPSKEEIINRLCKMQELGADLPKIAVMPNYTKDVITLLDATERMSRIYAKTPIITMSMGSLGLVSRISGEVFGSAITFGAVKKASAPGQIGVEKLGEVLDIINIKK